MDDIKSYLEAKHLTSKKVVVKQDLTSSEIQTIVKTIPFVTEQWLPYHCKAVRALGPDKYLQLADMARKGKHPASLMSYLLKQELT